MLARLLLLSAILALLGCAQGYQQTQPASPPASGPKFYSNPYVNPETQEEYEERLWWENYETEWGPFRRW